MVAIKDQDLHVWTTRAPDGTTEVYILASDVLTWLRSDEHAESNRELLRAVADMLDFAALSALVDSDKSD